VDQRERRMSSDTVTGAERFPAVSVATIVAT
jgi:hypothetical protein